MITTPIILIILPLFTALYVALFTRSEQISSDRNNIIIYLLTAILPFLYTLYLIAYFNSDITGNQEENIYQFTANFSWIKEIGLYFSVGIDGLSLLFIFLTSFLFLIAIISGISNIKTAKKEFLIYFLLLEAFCLIAFSATNLLLFYLAFEAILIPMYFVIGIWGDKRSIYATIKFFLFTLAGSLLFLFALIKIYFHAQSFDLITLAKILPNIAIKDQKILWITLFIGFAIKIPLPPLHSWLADAHVEAPTAGSVILAGILLKLGTYGLIRISLPFFPLVTKDMAIYPAIIGAISIIYASIIAFSQQNIKKTIAYSSIAHMGYCVCGMFSLNYSGMQGAIFQMFSHGIISALLFLIIGILYERFHTKEIKEYGGLSNKMPFLSIIFFIATMGSIAIPFSSGFIGEFLIIYASFSSYGFALTFLVASGVFLGAIYMLNLYVKIMKGNLTEEKEAKLTRLSLLEKITITPLAFTIIYLGIYPSTILNISEPVTRNILKLYF